MILIPAAVALAVLITGAAVSLRRAVRLERVLEDHDRAESALAELDLPHGGADCGCFWHYLPGGHIRLYTCGKHAFICTPGGEK